MMFSPQMLARVNYGAGQYRAAAGSVTLDAVGASFTGYSGQSSCDYIDMTIGTGNLLVVCIGLTGGDDYITSVIWDPTGANQSLGSPIQVQSMGVGDIDMLVYALVAPAAGNKTLRINMLSPDSVDDGIVIGVTAASFNGANGTLASAIPSGSIIHGNSGGSPVVDYTTSITIPANSYGLNFTRIYWGDPNSVVWTPTPDLEYVSRFLALKVGGPGTLSLKGTPDAPNSTYGAGIAIEIHP